ncbi:S-adenosyl-L-methionine-dependent methyltransferase [Ilyonectria robusta]|uniref:S-adenosyl-L-methionine-dependent methyltransferase n=1 Tax=Ilyonectria robusta TaxID=1079257 RepID=UPI001E8E5D6A|nr:S-adenosyl-L-methionine-dependent methyltransferase [Ilyonectria robusta]KAH8661073.1 S-adenosyl-L-methionine-dependent methyltransferase [Ilyonectria robusta]
MAFFGVTTAAEDNTGPTTASAAADDIIEVDPRANPDPDEGYQADWLSTATASISSSVRDYVFENNRRYHKFKEGRYLIPNDNEEQEREDMKHALVLHLCGGKLHLAPLDHPQNILDVGTGTGIWAIDMGDEYPSAEITGIDLSPIQPSWVPPNVKFIVDDAETEWVDPPNSLDCIHLRHMALTIKDMPRLLEQAYKALKPGGWIELQDFLYITHSDDGSKPDDYKYDEFVRLLREGFLKFGFDLHGQQKNEGMVKDAGFVNVDNKMYKAPIGTWPKNQGLKKAGLYNMAIILDFFSAVMAPFTRGLGWSTEQVEVFLIDVRKSIHNTNIHAYYTLHMVIGQKPLDAA